MKMFEIKSERCLVLPNYARWHENWREGPSDQQMFMQILLS